MENIFVTGANGFIGTYLIKNLIKKNYKVTAFVRKAKTLMANDNICIKTGNIVQEQEVIDAAKGCCAVIHLAAATDVSQYKINYETNVLGVKNVITACHKNKIKRVIFFSSHCAIRKNRDAYGETKKEGEDLFICSKLDYTIFRPNMICGLESKEFITFVNFIRRLPVVPMIGNGKNLFQPSYIEDVVEVTVAALKRPKSIGKFYELGGEQCISADDLVKKIACVLGLKRTIVHIPLPLCLLGAKILGYLTKNTIVSVDQVLAFSQDNTVNLDAIKTDLDYVPTTLLEFLNKIFRK